MSTSLSSRSSAATVNPTRQQLDELDALLQRMLELPVNSVEEEPPARTPDSLEEKSDRLEPRVLSMPATNEAATAPDSQNEDGETWVPLRSSWQPSAQTWGPLAKQWQEAQQAGQVVPKTPKKKKQAPVAPREDPAHEEVPVRPRPTVAERRDTEPERETPYPEDDSEMDEASASALPTSWQVDAHANEPLDPLPSLKALLPPLLAPSVEKSAESPSSHDEPPQPIWAWPFIAIDAVFDGCLFLLGPFGKPLRSPSGKSFLGTVGVLCLAVAAILATIDWFGWTW